MNLVSSSDLSAVAVFLQGIFSFFKFSRQISRRKDSDAKKLSEGRSSSEDIRDDLLY